MGIDTAAVTPAPPPFSGGFAELLADADRPGGWLVLLDRIRQSYVDLDEPRYLDFEYIQAFADVLETLPRGPIAVTHIGGGGCTLARYLAVTRPGSPQLVLEPDEALTALIRQRLPFPRGAKIRIRGVDGRTGLRELHDASADVVVLDAFHGGRVPPELTTVECLAEVARVLRDGGVLLVNVADGPPGVFGRRLAASLSARFASVLAVADPGVFRLRRFGNLVFAASHAPMPADAIASASARAIFARRVLSGAEFTSWVGGERPLTDADPMRSPAPPDAVWRVADGTDA